MNIVPEEVLLNDLRINSMPALDEAFRVEPTRINLMPAYNGFYDASAEFLKEVFDD